MYTNRAGPACADEAAVRGGRISQGEGAVQRLRRTPQRHLAHCRIQLLQGSLVYYTSSVCYVV